MHLFDVSGHCQVVGYNYGACGRDRTWGKAVKRRRVKDRERVIAENGFVKELVRERMKEALKEARL